MAKRIETLEIEKALINMCRYKRIYGCEEITIGFANNGYGNEIVDFMTMDSKGIIRCYEIKVTLQDLKSKAKKSWYGHYNYLVVSKDLEIKIKDFSNYVPDGIGIITSGPKIYQDVWELETILNPKKQIVTNDMNVMLKESMVRSMYHKMNKYKDSSDMEKQKELQQSIGYWKKQYQEENKEWVIQNRLIRKFEKARREICGEYQFFEDIVSAEMEKAGITTS